MDKLSRTINGKITYYVYDGNVVIEEQRSNNSESARNVYGRNLIIREASSDKYVYGYNGHGDVVYLTDTNGIVEITYDYDEFGNIISEEVVETSVSTLAPTMIDKVESAEENVEIIKTVINNPYRYACYEYIEKIGIYDLNARYYNPEIARFLSADPYYNLGNRVIGLYEINVPTAASIMQANNLYVYCGNKSTGFVDDSGKDAIVITADNAAGSSGLYFGHTSVIVQNDDGNWYYYYWGNKAAYFVAVPEEKMSSLESFNSWLSAKVNGGELKNSTKNYTAATYIEGDFSASYDYFLDLVENADVGTKEVFAGPNVGNITKMGNFDYSLFSKNCVTTSIQGLKKGTLLNGKNYGENFPYKTIIPKNYKNEVKEKFDNSLFVKE